MTIDMHVYPSFIREISEDSERVEFRRKNFWLYKQHVWPIELVLTQLDAAGIDKAVLLADDLTTQCGGTLVSNEEIRKLVDMAPDRFIGFAGVDPYREDALKELEYAFAELGLAGLNLHPGMQKFYPGDEMMKPIYELCLRYNKPIMFHSGLGCEPNAPMKYGKPENFEDVLYEYPELRICLAHFGWPWTTDVAALMLRHENLYTDTSLNYFDSPKEFMNKVFDSTMSTTWTDRTLRRQVMFGSYYPRIEQSRMVKAVKSLGMRESTEKLVFGENALRFLGMEK